MYLLCIYWARWLHPSIQPSLQGFFHSHFCPIPVPYRSGRGERGGRTSWGGKRYLLAPKSVHAAMHGKERQRSAKEDMPVFSPSRYRIHVGPGHTHPLAPVPTPPRSQSVIHQSWSNTQRSVFFRCPLNPPWDPAQLFPFSLLPINNYKSSKPT